MLNIIVQSATRLEYGVNFILIALLNVDNRFHEKPTSKTENYSQPAEPILL